VFYDLDGDLPVVIGGVNTHVDSAESTLTDLSFGNAELADSLGLHLACCGKQLL
jgi:hypothetical protein